MDDIKIEQVDRQALEDIWLLSMRMTARGDHDETAFLELLARHRLGEPEVDEAKELVDAVLKLSREKAIPIVRAALSKARAHPADVVEAAEDVRARYASETTPRLLAEYILK